MLNKGFNIENIEQLEQQRQSKVIVYAASNIDIETLPALYDTLRQIGHVKRLDVVLYSRGGIINAARRIALLLHEFTDQLSFIVPHYCESAATLLTLSGHEIVAGPLAIFSPIDPHLQASDPSSTAAPSSLSSQDVRLFSEMITQWFKLEEQAAQEQSMSILCNSIFPTTLTSFYRSTLELRQIGEQLLALQLPNASPTVRAAIIEQLLCGYHSHSYAITGDEMAGLGLNIKRQPEPDLIWQIATELSGLLGAGVCQSLEDGWHDVILATTNSIRLRQRKPDEPGPTWHVFEKP